jgi:opacity protein-like surface antigen
MGLASFVASSHEKTNVYVKAGLKFGYLKPAGAGGTTEFGIPAGIGLEYFVTKHFAVDLNTLSGLMTTSYEGYSRTAFSLSNAVVAVGLLWYH